ncbi:AAA family ATPase [Corynebacterium glucuronolyticum]|uniref:AAA family ATPase n=1 Tax=Corynebacterium glucuronolyticum TaxID=39791 RepID=UPI00223AF634|nr:AAA family ATPase [Corynebacterium glucuronolyticum]MCT1563579.1 AAA family ATPase [Corynebacterium glucuronolyticum]
MQFKKLKLDPLDLRKKDALYYSYNANSGGGQAFLSGKLTDEGGNRESAERLAGQRARLVMQVKPGDNDFIDLTSDFGGYEVKTRSKSSRQPKLAVGANPSPSRLIAAFLMLPQSCTVAKPKMPQCGPINTENFWVHQARLDVVYRAGIPEEEDSVDFKASDIILGTNVPVVGEENGEEGFYNVNTSERFETICTLASTEIADLKIADVLRYFRAVYQNEVPFKYEIAREKTDNVMCYLAANYKDQYAGIEDPLIGIERILGENNETEYGTGSDEPLKFETDFQSRYPLNLIVFGAPGTGKSYLIAKQTEDLLKDGGTYERVTFHADYTYGQFVGSYKPMVNADGEISYGFSAGPFVRTLLSALEDNLKGITRPHVLIIEEINRAVPSATFGDIFQLLDRDNNGVSEYGITTSEDLRSYLSEQLKVGRGRVSSIKLPNNMFIWATMNSADQGVFPMDSAFKRRWDFQYLSVDDSEEEISTVTLDINGQTVNWNRLRKAINALLTANLVNEDKQIGPFFLKIPLIRTEYGNRVDNEAFSRLFREKLLMYLFEDAGKLCRSELFVGVQDRNRFSGICEAFDRKGIEIFAPGILQAVQ